MAHTTIANERWQRVLVTSFSKLSTLGNVLPSLPVGLHRISFRSPLAISAWREFLTSSSWT